MAHISEEIEVKVEPWIHSSENDQVSYDTQASRCWVSRHYDVVTFTTFINK